MTDSAKPTFIYKLVPSSSPVPGSLPERLPVSDIDQSSGFVHLSTASQVPGTLKFFFKDDPKVYVLRIKYDNVEANIRWEDPKAEVCGPRGREVRSRVWPAGRRRLTRARVGYVSALVQRAEVGQGRD